MKKLTCLDIEIAVANFFNPRLNIIVPNVSWGLFLHECDMLVLTKSGYAYEIEIKTDKYDLIKDSKKKHGHFNIKLSRLYFAIPDYLSDYISHIPERAGILIVSEGGFVELKRKPEIKNEYRFTDKERLKLAELGTMRIWNLKRIVSNIKNENCNLRNNTGNNKT
jgi:hypothetical protein